MEANPMAASVVGAALDNCPVLSMVETSDVHFESEDDIDHEFVERLRSSISLLGLTQPIHVRPVYGQGHKYEVVAGKYRYMAWRANFDAACVAFDQAGRPTGVNGLQRAPELIAVQRWQTLPALVYGHKISSAQMTAIRNADNMRIDHHRVAVEPPRVDDSDRRYSKNKKVVADNAPFIEQLDEMYGAAWPGKLYDAYGNGRTNNMRLYKSGARRFPQWLQDKIAERYTAFKQKNRIEL